MNCPACGEELSKTDFHVCKDKTVALPRIDAWRHRSSGMLCRT
jgi:hypothetical protein